MPTLPIPIFVAAVLVFASLRLWQRQNGVSPLAVLLAICAAQSLIIALAQHYAVPGMRLVQPITATLIPVAAWLAFQLTAVRGWQRSDALHGLAPVTALAALLVAPPFLDVLLPGLFVVYGGLIAHQALHGPDAQPRALLSNGDLPAQIWLIISAVLMVSAVSDGLIIAAQVAGRAHLQPLIVTIFSVGNLLVIGIVSLSSHLQTDTAEDITDPVTRPEPDAAVMEQVTAYMASHRPYLDPDLTLARLARKLGIPAKTISTTINGATGENVSRYINAARIKAAQGALLAGESVTEAMLSSGFNTKSNFNREFLRVVGVSPRDWLNEQSG